MRSSETAYRLVRAYCREDFGRDADRIRYRIVTREVTPYSERHRPPDPQSSGASTVPWLDADEFDVIELRAQDYLEAYAQQKQAGLRADHD